MRGRRALLSLASLALTGCILLVHGADGGETCRFAGETTECGVCVADRCRSEVDGACAESAARPALVLLDGCATTHDGRCDELRALGGSPAAAALGACVRSKCSGACATSSGESVTSCREPPLGAEGGCTCESNGSANAFVCGRSTYPNTLCCASANWPAPGLACSCRPLGCTATNGGCTCTLVDFVKPDSPVCRGATCCAYEDNCVCRDRPCYPGEKQVEACGIDVVECPTGTKPVSGCSARAIRTLGR